MAVSMHTVSICVGLVKHGKSTPTTHRNKSRRPEPIGTRKHSPSQETATPSWGRVPHFPAPLCAMPHGRRRA